MKGYLCASRQNLRTADTRHVFRCYPVGLRISASRHGSVLLSHRPESLPRHKLLSGPRAALSGLRCREQNVPVFASVRDCPRDRPPRSKPPRNTDQGQEAQGGMDKAEANALQVRVELQADCLAGVWANHAQAKWQFIEPGDVEAALQTASAIGDDRLQRRTQGYVVPDAFTHGTSAQRTRWFMTGLKSGQVASCDTFRAEQI
jgi:Putative neutral zinc metallopeptidase